MLIIGDLFVLVFAGQGGWHACNFLMEIKYPSIYFPYNLEMNNIQGCISKQMKGRGQERPLDFLAIFKVLKNS